MVVLEVALFGADPSQKSMNCWNRGSTLMRFVAFALFALIHSSHSLSRDSKLEPAAHRLLVLPTDCASKYALSRQICKKMLSYVWASANLPEHTAEVEANCWNDHVVAREESKCEEAHGPIYGATRPRKQKMGE